MKHWHWHNNEKYSRIARAEYANVLMKLLETKYYGTHAHTRTHTHGHTHARTHARTSPTNEDRVEKRCRWRARGNMNVMYAGGQCCFNLVPYHDPCVILHIQHHQEQCKHLCWPTQRVCSRAAARTYQSTSTFKFSQVFSVKKFQKKYSYLLRVVREHCWKAWIL